MVSFSRRNPGSGSAIPLLGLTAALGPALAATAAPSVGPVQVTLIWPGHATVTLDDVTIVKGIEPAPVSGGFGAGRLRLESGQLILRRPIFPTGHSIGAGDPFQTDLHQWNSYEPSRARKEVKVRITVFDAVGAPGGGALGSKAQGEMLDLTCDYQNCTPRNWTLVTAPGPDSDPADPAVTPDAAGAPGRLEEQLEISYEKGTLSWSEPAE